MPDDSHIAFMLSNIVLYALRDHDCLTGCKHDGSSFVYVVFFLLDLSGMQWI